MRKLLRGKTRFGVDCVEKYHSPALTSLVFNLANSKKLIWDRNKKTRVVREIVPRLRLGKISLTTLVFLFLPLISYCFGGEIIKLGW